MGRYKQLKNYNPRIEITISEELNQIMNKGTYKYSRLCVFDFNKMVKDDVCKAFEKMGYDVMYCNDCHTLKPSSEFYTDESMCCMDCEDHHRRQITAREFEQVLMKTENKCAICGGEIQHIHHIIPKRHRGSDDVYNLIGLCTECHKKAHNGSFGNQNGYDEELAKELLKI